MQSAISLRYCLQAAAVRDSIITLQRANLAEQAVQLTQLQTTNTATTQQLYRYRKRYRVTAIILAGITSLATYKLIY